jgi:hypothetical protein
MENKTFSFSKRQFQALMESEYFNGLGMDHVEMVKYVAGLINENLSKEEFREKYIETTPTGWRHNALRMALEEVIAPSDAEPTIFKKFEMVGENMSFRGKLSIDPGDELYACLVPNDDLKIETFEKQNVYLFKIGKSIYCHTMKFYNPANNSVTVTCYNTDKVTYPDQVILIENIIWAYKVMRVGKFR